jgi:hypothetical protein
MRNKVNAEVQLDRLIRLAMFSDKEVDYILDKFGI